MAHFNVSVENAVNIFNQRRAPDWSLRTLRDATDFNVIQGVLPMTEGTMGLRADFEVCRCFKHYFCSVGSLLSQFRQLPFEKTKGFQTKVNLKGFLKIL